MSTIDETGPDGPSTGSEESDEVLVLRSQLGDRAALEQLVGRWHQPLLDLLRQITLDVDAAEDLAQETWISALRSLARLREPDRFRWWLFTIARRRAHDRLRHAYRSPVAPAAPDDLADVDRRPVPDQDDAEAAVADRDQIVSLLRHLDVELREVLALHHLHDWPVREVAAALDVPEGTVKSRLHRARRQLAPLTGDDRSADPDDDNHDPSEEITP